MSEQQNPDLPLGGIQKMTVGQIEEIDGVQHRFVFIAANSNTPLDYKALALRYAIESKGWLRSDDPDEVQERILTDAKAYLAFLQGEPTDA